MVKQTIINQKKVVSVACKTDVDKTKQTFKTKGITGDREGYLNGDKSFNSQEDTTVLNMYEPHNVALETEGKD